MLVTPGSDWEQLQDHIIHLYDLLHRRYYKSPSLQEKFDECIANKNHYTGEKKMTISLVSKSHDSELC